MIRETLSPDSRHATMVVTPGNGVSFQLRLTLEGISYEDQMSVGSGTNGAAPYWVRLVRSGDNFTGFSSPDGVNWTQCGPMITITNLVRLAYWGLAVTAHTTSTPSVASFDQITINHTPILAPVADQKIGAGMVMQVANSATDPDVPPQALIDGQFQFQINGDFGPDYFIQGSTNLNSPTNWVTLWSTNTPALPITWADPSASNYALHFYRALLGP